MISKQEGKELEMLKDETAPEDCELDKAQAEYQLSWRKCKTAMTAITAEISGLEMVLSQLHALPDGTSGKIKQAYLEQSEKSSAGLGKTKKYAVAKLLLKAIGQALALTRSNKAPSFGPVSG